MILWPALRELGLRQAGLFALYRLGLRSGHYRRACDAEKAIRQAEGVDPLSVHPLWQLPSAGDLQSVLGETGCAQLLAQADEVVAGQVRLFGGPPRALQLAPPGPLAHWTAYERGEPVVIDGIEADVKWVWEPGRLGWAYTLGRAYRISQDERYAAAFWDWMETFLEANPPYQGPHWASAQEVALRLVALTFGWQVFGDAGSASPQRARSLAQAVAVHAQRIPPTLVYARAQNNNHLLSEAAGLYTAGLFLPSHPAAARWRSLGWRWFNQAIRAQVASDGGYMQHSTSYHRLMLQTALWVRFLAENQGQALPGLTRQRLAAATSWLLALLDLESGCVPNLGPNDGAYILPLAVSPHSDYRPVLQAAAIAFLGERPFAEGPWDELGAWLGSEQAASLKRRSPDPKQYGPEQTPHVLRSPDGASWAYLRAARFTGRPGHADQLHFDLWWRGMNVTQDAGTYSYNAAPPWDNALARSEAHNTVVLNGQDQMRRAGRFLYVDWAQAEILYPAKGQDGLERRISARHDGYRRIGVWHQRDVIVNAGGDWEISDSIYPMQAPGSGLPVVACLHWLLPDWPWEAPALPDSSDIQLVSPDGPVRLHLALEQAGKKPNTVSLQIARAGELLLGDGPVQPTWGWSSPTYGLKVPALSVRFEASGPLPIRFTTLIAFPACAEPQNT
jgi:hypothetical protein